VPEGPEIRRAADRVARAVVGRVAERVRFAHAHLRVFEPLLRGEEVASVETRGKAMLTSFANGLVVYTHNQLYGRWFVRRAGESPATRRTLRLAIENADHCALLYSASEIEVLDAGALEAHPFLATLGPDVLAPELTPEVVAERLEERRFRGRQLGALLLDQRFLAGVGNYLRAEMLHEAGLHPAQRAGACAADQRRRLGRAVVDVARRAYETGGVTNDPERVARLRAEGEPRRRWRHHVFSRAGRPCWACGTSVERGTVGGRRVYWCPGCQPRRGEG
jgi:endonuclease-8